LGEARAFAVAFARQEAVGVPAGDARAALGPAAPDEHALVPGAVGVGPHTVAVQRDYRGDVVALDVAAARSVEGAAPRLPAAVGGRPAVRGIPRRAPPLHGAALPHGGADPRGAAVLVPGGLAGAALRGAQPGHLARRGREAARVGGRDAGSAVRAEVTGP